MGYQSLSAGNRTARKAHRCSWCGQGIEAGSTYKYQSGIFDGEMQIDKFHLECAKAAADECASEGGDWEFSPYENERPESQGQKHE